MNGNLLAEALTLSERGLKIFPCNQDKRPLVSSWRAEATTDQKKLEKWFESGNCLIAVLTGRENDLFVLDVDPAGESWFTAHEGQLGSSRIHETRRGRHLVYRFPTSPIIKTTTVGKLAIGIDTRGDGGYVIWWPACGLPFSGSLNDLQSPPQWLMAELTPKYTPRSGKATSGLVIREGGRNDALISFCGRLRYEGDSEEQMLAKALQFNAQRFIPLLDEREVRAVVSSAARYPKGSISDSSKALSEDSLALDFANCNPTLRYVSQWGRWMVWNGKVWTSDDTLAVLDKVRDFVRMKSGQKVSLLKASTIASVERLTRADRRYASRPSCWDVQDLLLNTQAGIVNLTTGALNPHDPELHMSKITSVAPGGEAPRWRSFLSEITDGDVEYQDFLQRVVGYSASGLTNEHALFFFFGTGSNGKSVFINTLHKVIGNYAAVASMETLTQSKFERHPTDLAMLQGARLAFAQETESGHAWAESKIKLMTGGDPISARFMRRDFFTFIPKFKLIIAGNHKPRIRHADEAMRRRLVLLPFTRKFSTDDRDLNLQEKLCEEMPGILQWIIDGARIYLKYGLDLPKVVRKATAEYFESEDLFKEFLDEQCDLSPAFFENPTKIYEAYKSYAVAANESPAAQVEFRQRMENLGFKRSNSRSKGGRHWEGISLKVQEVPNSWID